MEAPKIESVLRVTGAVDVVKHGVTEVPRLKYPDGKCGQVLLPNVSASSNAALIEEWLNAWVQHVTALHV